MNSSARLSAILERLANGESVAVADLIDELATSLATIRRDLAMPERPRLLARADDGVAHGHHDLPLRYKPYAATLGSAVSMSAVPARAHGS